MAKQLKIRRGTTAEHSTFTGGIAEITVDTNKKTVVVHDGVTAGGNPLLSAATGAVGTSNLADSSVTTAKIAAGAVATVDIADAAVTAVKIADLNITTAKIADGNVTTAKIADGNVTGAKLENSGVAAGTYGDSGNVPRVTLDAKGRVTGVSTQAISAAAPSTAQVLSATAGASLGAVGTYAFLTGTGQTFGQGGNYAASGLYYSTSGNPQAGTPRPSGTWKAMGGPDANPTLFLRIS